jgi:RHS repeat-associated protein
VVSTYDLSTPQNITGIAVTAYFMGGAYEVTTDANNVTLGAKKYYSIAGMTVAVNDGSGLQYWLTDHLGSVVAITNANGTSTSQQRYLPFGQVRTDIPSIPNSPITQTDFGYTGQRNVSGGLGLMDYHARMYDALLGRFVQPDTIMPGGPQGLNRFSYVNNNPINATDPTGHVTCRDDDYECIHKTHNPIPTNGGNGGDNGNNHQGENNHQDELNNLVHQCEQSFGMAPGCDPSLGTHYNEWPPAGYYIAGYKPHVELSQIDWISLVISGAGVIGDGATIITALALTNPISAPIAEFTGPVAVAGEMVNKVGIAWNIIQTIKNNDPSASAMDLASAVFKSSRMIPVVSLLANGVGIYKAIEPAIYQQPILKPIIPTTITTSP